LTGVDGELVVAKSWIDWVLPPTAHIKGILFWGDASGLQCQVTAYGERRVLFLTADDPESAPMELSGERLASLAVALTTVETLLAVSIEGAHEAVPQIERKAAAANVTLVLRPIGELDGTASETLGYWGEIVRAVSRFGRPWEVLLSVHTPTDHGSTLCFGLYRKRATPTEIGLGMGSGRYRQYYFFAGDRIQTVLDGLRRAVDAAQCR
jgi:hypothetical protein